MKRTEPIYRKGCTSYNIQGDDVINISLGLGRYEVDAAAQVGSVDYLFIRDDNNNKLRLVCLEQEVLKCHHNSISSATHFY
jgi:hypothetical protein